MNFGLSLASRRDAALGMARWSAGRLVISETHYFRSAVTHARTGHERDRVFRERWRGLAIEFGDFLDDSTGELAGLGMGHAAVEIAIAAADRIESARIAYLEAEGLDPRLAGQTPLAVESARRPAPNPH